MKFKIWIKPILVLAGLTLLLLWGGKTLNIQQQLADVLVQIEDMGGPGMSLFIVLYIFATVLFIPGSILTLGAGAIYGVVMGSVLVSLASTLGATAAFLVGRYLVRDWIQQKIAGNARFSAIDQAVADEGWKIVGLTRLSPIFSFTLLNYAYGLTRVKFRDYLFASWIGMMPGTVMYVYFGALAGDLASLGTETAERTKTPGEWVMYGIWLLATIGVTVYVTQIAKKALSEKIDV